jgi:hypothetical protein
MGRTDPRARDRIIGAKLRAIRTQRAKISLERAAEFVGLGAEPDRARVAVDMMWRKSSKSNSDGTCVEVRHDLAAVRDSKQSGGPQLAVPALSAFIKGVKDGRFSR